MLAPSLAVPAEDAPRRTPDALPGDAPTAPPRRRANPLQSTRVQSVMLLAALLGAWEGAVRFFNVPRHLVPPFSDMAVALWRGWPPGRWRRTASGTTAA
jgi:NitT/TauT family transport system permease protein